MSCRAALRFPTEKIVLYDLACVCCALNQVAATDETIIAHMPGILRRFRRRSDMRRLLVLLGLLKSARSKQRSHSHATGEARMDALTRSRVQGMGWALNQLSTRFSGSVLNSRSRSGCFATWRMKADSAGSYSTA